MIDAKGVLVMISAPGDTSEEVDAIKSALHGLNGARAERDGVIVLPQHWKSDAIPRMGSGGPQGIINEQIVDKADILVALFDSRLGQATTNAVSGTAEEIDRAIDQGKFVHVWFSNEDLPRNADLDQLAKLRAFRADLEKRGLLGEYANPQDLAYQVRAAVEHDIYEMDLTARPKPTAHKAAADHAMPRLRYDDGSKRVILENKSQTVKAEQLTLEVIEKGPFRLFYDGTPIDLPPLSEVSFPITLAWGANKIIIRVRWLENGEIQEETITLTF
ncbi:hypothetical protein MKUB_54060 [Mycobacterium kubicae]|uniref:DUF4062 domain-containing protein n=1 Tax=Mycobacterium kubicae TaxID=120959 RepID=A0AAX1J3Z1_9MYCO|nr:hypothetical protein [Mycobacterium kubicae]MCV7097498.1 hypothetical protein [Mycobacterium kubicae]ORV96458.1 hypothetical protein AWC13_18620 [Mycobacterium kubicae]QNI12677.1 hypothetical protein GAN18_17010 [Mycobacterium kubicae]QPI36198.1 hypothetical protein I2456_16790 [Mycobacterium kubicae]GFG67916.1 hypothetical protein MKUB_54060 [Mycobacterium kubicae]